MKAIITIIFLMSGICSQGQTNSVRIAALEKQQTIFKADIRFLRSEKTIDSSRITFLSNIVFQQNASINQLLDSITVLRKSIPTYLILHVDTMSGLKFKQDTLYIRK